MDTAEGDEGEKESSRSLVSLYHVGTIKQGRIRVPSSPLSRTIILVPVAVGVLSVKGILHTHLHTHTSANTVPSLCTHAPTRSVIRAHTHTLVCISTEPNAQESVPAICASDMHHG